MGAAQARRLCPEAAVVPCRMEAYSEASKAVFEIFEDTAPVVEALSIDEAFLDVRGMEHFAGTPVEIATRLRRAGARGGRSADQRGRRANEVPGQGRERGGEARRAARRGAPDRELEFLHPLPVERLWGVGPITSATLHDAGLHTVGPVAELADGRLVEMLGRASGRHLHALAQRARPAAGGTRRRRRSIGAQHALGRRSRSPEAVDAALVGARGPRDRAAAEG